MHITANKDSTYPMIYQLLDTGWDRKNFREWVIVAWYINADHQGKGPVT